MQFPPPAQYTDDESDEDFDMQVPTPAPHQAALSTTPTHLTDDEDDEGPPTAFYTDNESDEENMEVSHILADMAVVRPAHERSADSSGPGAADLSVLAEAPHNQTHERTFDISMTHNRAGGEPLSTSVHERVTALLPDAPPVYEIIAGGIVKGDTCSLTTLDTHTLSKRSLYVPPRGPVATGVATSVQPSLSKWVTASHQEREIHRKPFQRGPELW